MSTSWFVPASLLSNVIVNALSAGAASVATSNLIPEAVIAMPPGPPEPPGPPDGAGDPPGAPPAAERGGNQPALSAIAATTRNPKTGSTTLGQAGAGMFSRWPVASASTTFRYSLRASLSQPSRVTIVKMTPTARTQPPNTRPPTRTNVQSAARSGRNDGPGTCTPGGGALGTTAGSCGCSSARWSYSRRPSRPQ